MPRHDEHSANDALGNLLRPMLGWAKVHSENTRVVEGRPGLRPDIWITAKGRSPVVVEAEYLPAATAESEAMDRLGLKLTEGGTVEAVIALRYPADVGDAADLSGAVAAAVMDYCFFTQEKDSKGKDSEGKGSIVRFPQSGWLKGQAADLADLIRLVSVPQRAVDEAADYLQQGIDDAAKILQEMARLRPAISAEIAGLLGMDNVPQTRRMACAIIANAMIFHDHVAGRHSGVEVLQKVCGCGIPTPQDKTLKAWKDILDINYYPIFAIGRDLLAQLPSDTAVPVLHCLRLTAESVNGTGVSNSHDLTGRVFQRLISDRKYLATFYTLPASAALLARLAVAKLDGVDWSDAGAIGKLRVGDFACGTGALLSAVYEQVAARHESAGGNAAAIHPVMLEEVLYGCDVMPSAIHITGSTLSGIQPDVGYGKSRLYTMPYGRQDDGSVKIGSLELLQSSATWVLFNTSDPALRTGSAGQETAAQIIIDVPDEGFDLVIMNPPFTSNTKHYDAGDGVVNAAFAAFDASERDQDDMAARMRVKTANTCYHGHAGLASAFAGMADRKVRSGGVVAFVLPFTAINGASWAKFRELIATQYTDIAIISIAANGKDMSFSSDTGMAECLVIARRISTDENPDFRANFVSLSERPAGLAAAAEIAKAIPNAAGVRHLEDGPYGGSAIHIGEAQVGEALNAPLGDYETGWGAARIADASLSQTAYALSAGKLWPPAQPQAIELPVAMLNQVGQRGLDSQLFISAAHKGPFTKAASSATATYPALWNHNAKNETKMICKPDSQLHVRRGMESEASKLWATASRAHINRDFTFGSQALAVAYTERDSVGGRVWPNVIFGDKRFDCAFAVWGNSTLGLLSYWWHSSRQQSSKAGMTIRQAETMPVLDFRALSDGQLAAAEGIFGDFRELELLPAYLADADPNRALLDRRVVSELLGLGEEAYRGVRRLAAKWCAEPSVHGGKRRPAGAGYVE